MQANLDLNKRITDGFRDSLVFYKLKISGRKSDEMVKSDHTNSSKILTNGKPKVVVLVHAQSGLKGPQGIEDSAPSVKS